jgi:transcriptional regulator with XRE-family HTH domain
MILLRHELGDELRRLRQRQGRTLREVSAAARVSLGYLSEVERGQKEASSELLASICSALDVPLSTLLDGVVEGVRMVEESAAPAVAPVAAPGAPAALSVARPVAPAVARKRRAAHDGAEAVQRAVWWCPTCQPGPGPGR